jgi:rsbT antagonist protein RsbS
LERSPIPILKLGEYLISSPQVALHDKMAVQFKDDILQRIIETRAKGLVLDLSAIDIVDSFLVRQIGEIAMTTSLMGARVVVVGLRPEVAMALTEMGFTVSGVETARDLEKGFEILRKAGKR